jgi:citrate lyase subunit beta/citryl-CoA lyase
MMVLRSLLFVPGNSLRMITKAATLPVDAVIFDLEDAVPLPDKETARIMVRDSVKAVKAGGVHVFVRINALTTGLTAEDINVVGIDGLDGILLAKAESGSDVIETSNMLGNVEKNLGLETSSIRIIPLVETAKGIINVYEIASSGERVVAVGFGAGDYYRDLGLSVASLTPEQNELLFARSQTVVASRAAGVSALDTVFFGQLTDREGLMKETLLARQLGFKGKMVIHPTQIEVVNQIFSPSLEEAEESRKIVAAFEEAQSRGLGAVSLDGKMIDIMNYRQARDMVDFVDLIAGREEKRQPTSAASLLQYFAASR